MCVTQADLKPAIFEDIEQQCKTIYFHEMLV
jgi:hypothetical protein